MSSITLESPLKAGSGDPFPHVTVTPRAPGQNGRIDVTVTVSGPPRGASEEGRQYYFNLYLADLRAARDGWTPRSPITYPEVSSLPAPFSRTIRDITCETPYLGVLVSVCNALHEEVAWECRVFHTKDGREVRDCRAWTGKWRRRTG